MSGPQYARGFDEVDYRRVIDPMTQQELLVPHEISDDRAIEQARIQRAGELRVIRFFLDWGHNYPLWESFTGKYAMEPSDYDLSPELGQRLLEWSQFWQRHFDPFDDWDEQENEDTWLTRGHELVRLLEVEVYDIAVIWPQFGPSRM